MVTILIPVKWILLGFLKINAFYNKIYDVLTSSHGATNKILSYDWTYFIVVVMFPMFGNFRISMRNLS